MSRSSHIWKRPYQMKTIFTKKNYLRILSSRNICYHSISETFAPIKNFRDNSRPYCIFIRQWLYSPFVGPWTLIQFPNLFYTDRTLGRVIRLSQGLYLPKGQHKHTIKVHTHKNPYLE
jgi:hypothetical protein